MAAFDSAITVQDILGDRHALSPVGDPESAQFGRGHVIKSFRQTFFRVLSTYTYHLFII